MIVTTKEDDVRFSLKQCYSNKACKVIDLAIIAIVALLILLCPLPFGSVEYRWIFIVEMTAALCLCLWFFKLFFLANNRDLIIFRSQYASYSRWRQSVPFFHRRSDLAKILRFFTFGYWPRKNPVFDLVPETEEPEEFEYTSFFGFPIKNTGVEKLGIAFLLLVLLQLLPIPSSIIAVLSPETHELYESAAQAAGIKMPLHPISLNPFTTLSSFLLYCAYFCIYLVTVNTARTRQSYLILIYAIIGSALFQSLYGLYELFSGHQHIFWYKKKYFLNSASGTFINRNHFAAYVGLAIPLIMALITGHFVQSAKAKGNALRRFFRILDMKGGKLMFQFIFLALIGCGAAFSLSLTGLIAIFLSCFVFILLYNHFKRTNALYWVCGLTIILAVTCWFSSEQFRVRILGLPQEVLSERSRFSAWEDSAQIALRFPLFGTGLGTFPEAFHLYRSFGTNTVYSNTHNEYLQLLSETGVCSILFFASFVALIAMQLKKLFRISVSRLVLIQMGALSSIFLLAAHNFVDFSFQIPAVALTTMVILALFFGGYRGAAQANAQS